MLQIVVKTKINEIWRECIYPSGQWDLIFIIYKISNYKIMLIIILWLYLLEQDYDTSGVYSTAESTANLVGI